MSSFYILDINPLFDIQFTNIFFHSVCCLFILLIVSFAVQKFLVLYSPMCWILLLFVFLVSYPKTHCQDQLFSSRSFVVSGLTFKFLKFQVNFCEWCNTGVQFYFSACVYPVFPAPSEEETVHSTMGILGALVIYEGLILGSLFCLFVYVSIFMSASYCYNHYSFVV